MGLLRPVPLRPVPLRPVPLRPVPLRPVPLRPVPLRFTSLCDEREIPIQLIRHTMSKHHHVNENKGCDHDRAVFGNKR